MTQIALIAAMAHDRVIGKDNLMPWHMPADLKHFKALTLNKPVIMGRNTFLSIGKALPNRRNIVVTRQPEHRVEGCEMAGSLTAALEMAGNVPELMIIGGAQLYQTALPLATLLYLTLIDADIEGDARFPAWVAQDWEEIAREAHPADDKNPYPYTFVTLKRRALL